MPLKAPAIAPAFSWTGSYVWRGRGRRVGAQQPLRQCRYLLSPALRLHRHGRAGCRNPGHSRFSFPGTTPLPGIVTLDSGPRSSFLGGVQAGYNVQFGSTVVGIEGQIDGLKVSRAFAFTGPSLTSNGIGATFWSESLTGAGTIERNVEGSLRGRVGQARDRWRVSGTGGVAVTSLRGARNLQLQSHTWADPRADCRIGQPDRQFVKRQ